MKVAVISTDAILRKRMAGAIADAGFKTLTASDLAGFTAILISAAPDVIVVDWRLTEAVMQKLRSAPRQSYVIATQAQWSAEDITAAYARGVHDFVKHSATNAELIGRVTGYRRMEAWARATTASSNDLTSVDLSRIRAWRELAAIVGTDLGEMFGLSFAPTSVDSYNVAFASKIALTLATDRVEVQLAIGIDSAAAVHIGQTLIGDTSTEALADALREMANTAGGAMKRAALLEGLTFTLGLPENDGQFSSHETRHHMRTPDGLSIVVATTVRSIAPKTISAEALREGMVIARDLKNTGGILLAAAGTYLTSSTAERLSRIAGPSRLVEISVAAAA
ncbi:MAG TPA: response regulator [Kofleriaceae bacterium]